MINDLINPLFLQCILCCVVWSENLDRILELIRILKVRRVDLFVFKADRVVEDHDKKPN